MSQIETRAGLYTVKKCSDGTFRIELDGVDKHGVCSAEDVISWLSNALHNAEHMLMKAK